MRYRLGHYVPVVVKGKLWDANQIHIIPLLNAKMLLWTLKIKLIQYIIQTKFIYATFFTSLRDFITQCINYHHIYTTFWTPILLVLIYCFFTLWPSNLTVCSSMDCCLDSYHRKLGWFFHKNDTKMTITRKINPTACP